MMRARPARTLCSTVIAALLSTSLAAQIHITAMLSVTGKVMVNGAEVPATTAVFSGDAIQTANNGAAALSLPGSAIAIPENSVAVFQGDLLELRTGTAEVSTTRGLRARVERILVAPSGGYPARFEVKRLNDSIVITAEAGTLTITGNGTTTLESGTSAVITDGGGGTPRVVTAAAKGSGSGKLVAVAGVGGGAAALSSTVVPRKKAGDASPVHP